MINKKLLTVAAALTLIGVISAGATLAFFTDSANQTNRVTLGHVDIEMTEPNFDKDDGQPDNHVSNITPGNDITKDPTITLAEGSLDAYIRVKVDITGDIPREYKDDILSEKNGELATALNVDMNNWIYSTGYFYYKDKLTSINKEVILFNKITIPRTWGNAAADKTFEIILTAEAIQADNFTPGTDADGVYGWYADQDPVVIEPYTVTVS